MTPILIAALIVAVIFALRGSGRSVPLAGVVLAVVALGVIATGGWFVHPVGALTLAWLASFVFSRKRRRNLPLLAGGLGMLFALSLLGASWLVHPAAGMALGVLASVLFTRRRRDLPDVAGTLAVMALLGVLGASWVAFPASSLMLAWLATVMFSGKVFVEPKRKDTQPDGELTASPHALPATSIDGATVWTSMAGEAQAREDVFVPAGRRASSKRRSKAGPGVSGPKPDAPDTRTQIERVVGDHGAQLPPEATSRLEAIRQRGAEALQYLTERGLDGSEHALLARHIVDEYAPDAVKAYLRLPPSTANTLPLQDGKTGRDLLIEQLDLLLDGVARIISDATVSGGRELLAHQRFLEAKFLGGKKDFELD
ncbi:hypothetical protein [Deinococcus peraridilitoris]|uniref:Uncharacterized protein n=1 Tax=Deinococcus peraridilitoris (strain DSM 19664 / LMG 22246 / CIP 109416 / KR-200) TaxID=937777 RepID=L0A6Z3_DEIPD|nr:hypothetical protein [Deinococcus peraridilitoris]AFZ68962.1 hypothetical protein Deipe_3532 [Deinococcus peraridilitoris DSM 19664]